jgi:hypothetical protein
MCRTMCHEPVHVMIFAVAPFGTTALSKVLNFHDYVFHTVLPVLKLIDNVALEYSKQLFLPCLYQLQRTNSHQRLLKSWCTVHQLLLRVQQNTIVYIPFLYIYT